MISNKIMLGLWRYIIGVPPALWEKQIAKGKRKYSDHLAFMSKEHRLVHHFAVRQLPLAGKPLAPEFISRTLHIPLDRVRAILDDLESHLTFLFRDPHGAIAWAYPVTVDKTPHRVTFRTGERLYAA